MSRQQYAVLCVDDEIENVEMLKRILGDTFTVYGATSGQAGLDLLKSCHVDAIVSDQRMPGMTGLQFLHEVRKTDSRVVLVILTAYGELNMAVEAINNERIQGYFLKPVQSAELIRFLSREFERLALEDENRALLKQTQTLNEELGKLNTMKSEFLRLLSHEIRTPLTTILACLDLLKPGTATEDKAGYEELWQHAQSSSETLRGILDDVLYLLEIENLGFQAKPQPIALKQLVRLLIDRMKQRFSKKSLEIKEEFTNDPQVMADPTALTRILTSLLGNAAEFSTTGGSVQVGFKPSGDQLKIWIKHTGTGVHPEFHERVFQIINEPEVFNGRSIIGTGIGMAIAKVLTEALGGQIHLERDAEQADAVIIKLPYKKKTTAADAEPTPKNRVTH